MNIQSVDSQDVRRGNDLLGGGGSDARRRMRLAFMRKGINNSKYQREWTDAP